MEQRNCVPYFVNTPPPNIRKDFADGSKAEESKSSISRNAIKLDPNESQKIGIRYVQSNSAERVGGLGFHKFGIGTNDISTTTGIYSKENNPITGLRDDSNAMPQTQTNRYKLDNDLKAGNRCKEHQNYLTNRLKSDTGKSYGIARSSNLSSNIYFTRPPPMNQIPNQQYHLESDRLRSAEVTKRPSLNSRSPVNILETSPNRAPQQNGNIRSPPSMSSQQSSRSQSSGSSFGPPQSSQRSSQSNNMTKNIESLQGTFLAMQSSPRSTPPTAHSVWPSRTTDMQFIKTKPTLTGVRTPPFQPPMPAGPPPSTPPPPPGPPPPGQSSTAAPTLGPSPTRPPRTGSPPKVKRQLQTLPSKIMGKLQTQPHEGDKQQHSSSQVMRRLPSEMNQLQTPPFDVRRQFQMLPQEANRQLQSTPQEMQKQSVTPPGPPPDLKQQMQTPPPSFVTPPGQSTYYTQAPPFFFAIESYTAGELFKVPPPPIDTRRAVPGTIFQGSKPNTYYIQESNYVSHQNSGYNHYKRNRVSDNLDPELRRGSKKKKKSLAQILPQRKGWSVEDAKKAIEIEKECSKGTRKYSLFIKFPDPELNREIVSSFHSAIESVHFQQPSTPRFCFVNISSSADPEAVRQELNKVQFGGGYLSAEFKKDREDDFNINPEDIDPTTLYVGNLAQEVTKDDMLRMYPKTKRIDIGYAKKMKFTRYAFVVFRTAADAIEAYKTTHDTQMYSKSLIVRFRRMNGTIGMLGEPKVQSKTETDQIQNNSETNDQVPSQEKEREDHSLWDIDVSTWETNYNEIYDDDDDEDMMDVKPSLEDLEKDVKVPREYITPILPGAIDLADLPRPKKWEEVKEETATEEGTKEHEFNISQDKSSSLNEAKSLRLPVGQNDSVNTSSTDEVSISDLSNTVRVKNELGAKIKSEIDGNPDDKSLRSTYRQLMLARMRKRLTIKVEEECGNTFENESEKDESLDPENEKMNQVCSQAERTDDSIRASPKKSPDRSTSQADLKNPGSTADVGKQLLENANSLEICEAIKKEIKDEPPHLPTKTFISTYADLREVGRKMKNVNRLEVKKEHETGICDLQDDQMRHVGAHEIDTCLSPGRQDHTDTTDQTKERENVQPSELSQNEVNLMNAINNPQTNRTQYSNNELEFDSLMGISERQNEASEQENDEFSFDVDLNESDDIKKEPRMEDDNENDADLDEDDDDDDDIANFLKRRKAHM